MGRNSKFQKPRLTARQRRKEGSESHEALKASQEMPQRERRSCGPIVAKSESQKLYLSAISNFQLTFGIGPAGTGKTWVAAARAAQALEEGDCNRIIITRPAVEAGESLGFLPGELDEKFDPYLWPFRDVLNERLGKSRVDMLLKNGTIEAVPLAYMRGRTFRDCFVILDEAQNTTPLQMKMFLTRIGEGSKVVVNGDMAQSDIRGQSGLEDAIQRVSWIPSVKVIRFDRKDIVRSGLCQEIVESYERATA